MFERTQVPEECRRMMAACLIQKFYEYRFENARRLGEIEEHAFHEAFSTFLFILYLQRMDVVEFSWNTELKRYDEVDALLKEFAAKDLLVYTAKGSYEFGQNAGSRLQKLWNVEAIEHVKLRNAADVCIIAYHTRVPFTSSVRNTGRFPKAA